MRKPALLETLALFFLFVLFSLFYPTSFPRAEDLFVSGGGGGNGGNMSVNQSPSQGGAHAGSGGGYISGQMTGGGGAYVGNGANDAEDGGPAGGGQGYGPGAENGGDDGKGGDALFHLTGPAAYDSVTIQGGTGGGLTSQDYSSSTLTNTGGRAVLTSSGPLAVSGDFSVLGGEGALWALPEEKAESYYQFAVDYFAANGVLLEHSGRAAFSGTDLGIGGNLTIEGGQGGQGGTSNTSRYVSSTPGSSARLTAKTLAVGGGLTLTGGSNGGGNGGNGGDARLLAEDSLLVGGDFTIRAGNGGGMDLQDIIRFESYIFGALSGGAALASAGRAEIHGSLTLTGGGDGSAAGAGAGAVAEERAGEFTGLVIDRLNEGPYSLLGYSTYEEFRPIYGDLDSLVDSGLLGLTGFTSAPAFFSAGELTVHGTVALQGGLGGIRPVTSDRGRYATAFDGGAAIILARNMTVGDDLLVGANEGISGDARVLVEEALGVNGDMVLQSSPGMSYIYDYEQGESRDGQIQLLQDYIDFESYIFGEQAIGGTAYVQAGLVEVNGNLSISGGAGGTNVSAEGRAGERYARVLERERASDSTLAGNGVRAELRAESVKVGGDVSLQGGNGADGATSDRGRYTAPSDGGAALLYAASLDAGGSLSLTGGNYSDGSYSHEFSSRGGQALIVLEQDLSAAGGARLQGGHGGAGLQNQLSTISGEADFYERAAGASITARDVSLGNSLEIYGGQGHSASLSAADAGSYANILTGGRALVTARNVSLGGDLVIQGGRGGDAGDSLGGSLGGSRGGLAALDADGAVSLYGNAFVSDGEYGADDVLSGGMGGAARLTAESLTFMGSGARTFSITTHNDTLVDVKRLALYRGLALSLDLDSTLAGQTSLGILTFDAGSMLAVNSVNSGQFSYSGLEVRGYGARFEADAASLDPSTAQAATFILPGRLNSGSTAMLTVAGHDLTLSAADIVTGNGITRGLGEGQSTTLLTVENGLLQDLSGIDGTSVTTRLGDVFDVHTDAGNVYLRLQTYKSVNAFKTLAQSRLAGAVQLNRAADLLTDRGWLAFDRGVAGPQGEPDGANEAGAMNGTGSGIVAFAATGGYHGRAKTGSHIDADGFNLLTGLGARFTGRAHALDAAVFLETGWGSYNTSSNYANIMSVTGDGHSRYLGAGLMARLGLDSGLYVEASARAGRLYTTFDANGLGLSGNDSAYDSHNWYYGAHGGLGYKADLTDDLGFDLAARLLWTRQNAATLHMDGDNFQQKRIDSVRSRVSARLHHSFSRKVDGYVGLGSEYEFGAKAESSHMGASIDAPELKGHSGFAELGLGLKLSGSSTLDLGGYGSMGRYEGVGGSVRFTFEF